MGVVVVGKDMECIDCYFKFVICMFVEIGVNIVKSYYCENFEEVVVVCLVFIVVVGGKKFFENEVLKMVYYVISEGVYGFDMGRNIF